MGALHPGHVTLLQEARRRADRVVVSVFVNPLQFGPQEDLARYPRDLAADVAVCEENGVDVVFAPSAAQMYPCGSPDVTVDPGPLGDVLEGASRPGHFRGVLTVVAKLFALSGPDVAVFGEKDYQQLVLIRRMVTDLSLDVDVVGVETVRDRDGLAFSSRNRYLSPPERRAALSLSRAMVAGAAVAHAGRDAVLAAAHGQLDGAGVSIDYLELRSPDLLAEAASGPGRLLVAASVGRTRLIDNIAVRLP
jgi:pantoate--beta-alanine ligase